METAILISHIIIAILLSVSIIAQEKGSGIGAALAGGGGGGGFQATQRGAAKVLHFASIIFSVLFIASAIAIVLV
jgi:protein translocase SecG subunit